MKYLKEFTTQADYEAAKDGLITPNVSLITENNKVEYKPYDPTMGHDYVEIGGVKWATMNVGAESVTDAGLYFQWGDTQGYTAEQVGSGEGKKYFGWNDYKYWTANTGSGSSGVTKYNGSDSKTELEASDDGVAANWGGKWRMPTTADFVALGNAVNTAWTQVNGVYGLQCTDKQDSSKVLFFPAAGYANNGSMSNVGSYGYCWSSSLNTRYVVNAYDMSFNGTTVNWQDYYARRSGFPLRGVLAE